LEENIERTSIIFQQINFKAMKKNMGSTDKIVRIILAAIVAILYFTNVISGTLAIVLGALALIFVLTSFISFCPLYPILGINTKKKKVH
jgi:O-antigen/teichoic acid export membrane protein